MSIFGRGVSAIYQIQSAFSTFPSSGTWVRLAAYEHSEGETRAQEDDPLLGVSNYNARDPVATGEALPQGGGQKQVPICMRQFGWWLTLALGAPETTEGTGPDEGIFTHVWESGKDALPSFAQSKLLKSDYFERARGLMVNTLAFNLEKAGGFPRATLGTMLRDTEKATVQATGTIATALALLRPAAARPFVRRNAGAGFIAAPTTAFTFNYSNQLERYDPLNGTEYPDGFDPGDTQLNGSFTIRKVDSLFEDLADAKTAQPWQFGWSLPNGLGVGKAASLTVELQRTLIERGPTPINSPGRLMKTYNFKVEQDADGPALTATLVNDVEGYPPPP